jgi:hypothetical protein
VLNVEVIPGRTGFQPVAEKVAPPVADKGFQPTTEFKPGQKAKVKVKLTDFAGKPFVGTTVVAIYDKALEYISGGSNVPDIKEFFWKWRRHQPAERDDAGSREPRRGMPG